MISNRLTKSDLSAVYSLKLASKSGERGSLVAHIGSIPNSSLRRNSLFGIGELNNNSNVDDPDWNEVAVALLTHYTLTLKLAKEPSIHFSSGAKIAFSASATAQK